MPVPYSRDLRVRVLADCDSGMSSAAVARKYTVSTRWIYNLRRLREETGDIAPRNGKPGPQPKLVEHSEHLLQMVEERPDASLEELQSQLREELDVSAGLSTIWRALDSLGLTYKKGRPCC